MPDLNALTTGGINPIPQQSNLEQLAQMYLASQAAQPAQTDDPRMITAGGRVLGMNRSTPSTMQNVTTGLTDLAKGLLQMSQMKKQNDFFTSVHDIMGTNATTDEKKQKMWQLIAQHNGQDYGIGIKDMLAKDLGQQSIPVYKTDDKGNIIDTGEKIVKGSKVIPASGGGFGAAYIKFSEEMAPAIADAVKKGDFATFDQADTRTKTVVSNILAKDGFDVTKAKMAYTGLNQWTRTMNQNQMVGLNTAFNTVAGDIPVMKQLNTDLQRTNLNLANKLLVGAKLQGVSLNTKGMNDQQIRLASQFVTQLNLMRDNMAVAFQRGGVPSEQAFKLTDEIINPIYGGVRIDAALDQIQQNLSIRKNAVAQTMPVGDQSQSGQLSAATGGQKQGNSITLPDGTTFVIGQ